MKKAPNYLSSYHFSHLHFCVLLVLESVHSSVHDILIFIRQRHLPKPDNARAGNHHMGRRASKDIEVSGGRRGEESGAYLCISTTAAAKHQATPRVVSG